MLEGKTVGFVGAGAMAEAILSGLIQNGQVPTHHIAIINRQNKNRLSLLAEKYKLTPAKCCWDEVLTADIVIVAVKPKDLLPLLREHSKQISKDQLLISVAAGIETVQIERALPTGVAVVRAMPNTSSAVGLSATALAAGRWAKESALKLTKQIFTSIGSVMTVKESQMDAVTGLSGSGPAYFYYIVEALEQAGVKAGLSRTDARALTKQTILGAAHMLTESGQEARTLRQAVSSPQGTTMAGLEVLAQCQVAQALEQAVLRAKNRSSEMGKEIVIQSTDK